MNVYGRAITLQCILAAVTLLVTSPGADAQNIYPDPVSSKPGSGGLFVAEHPPAPPRRN